MDVGMYWKHCEGLANRRLQPLGHISGANFPNGAKGCGQVLSAQGAPETLVRQVHHGT